MKESPRFGANQALIFTSTNDSDAIFDNMNKWLNSHPFILTTLDSKGLEFDDVVIAFDVDRKPWDIKATQESSLRLIRELYVAFTRAKRRVVVLIKSNVSTMKDFFLKLEDCNIIETDAKTAFLEFNSDTSPDEWFERGMSLFEVHLADNTLLYFILQILDSLHITISLLTGRRVEDCSRLFQGCG